MTQGTMTGGWECVGHKHTWVAGWVAPTDWPNSAVVLRNEHHISYLRLLLLREESNGSEGEVPRRETATHRWNGCEASSLVSEFVRQQGVLCACLKASVHQVTEAVVLPPLILFCTIRVPGEN